MAGLRKGEIRGKRSEQLPLFQSKVFEKLERENRRVSKVFFEIRLENRVTIRISLATVRMLRRRFETPEEFEHRHLAGG